MNKYDVISMCLICLLLFSVADALGYGHLQDRKEDIEFEEGSLEKSEEDILESSIDIKDPIPSDGQEGLNSTPKLSVLVNHTEEQEMDVSFYDNETESEIDSAENVTSGERAEVVWESLDPNKNYSWHVVVENQTEGGPWNFTTAGVDYVKITDEVNGTALSDKEVPPNYEEGGYLSTYNDTYGFFDNPFGEWNVTGDASLLYAEENSFNVINVGETAGDVWFNVTSIRDDYQDSVKYTVVTDDVDHVKITDSPGGEPLDNETVEVGHQVRGYCSVYNEDGEYLYTVSGNWSAEGGGSSLSEDSYNESNVIEVGDEAGDVWFNLTYENSSGSTFHDSVKFEVRSPTVDSINITETPGGNALEGGNVPVGERIWGNASGYNETAGYVDLVEAEWNVDGGGAQLLETDSGVENGIDVGTIPEKVWLNASYEGKMDSVQFSVKEPEIDGINIRSQPDGAGDIIDKESLGLDETIDLYAAGYNETAGFVSNLEVEWDLDSEDVGEIDEDNGTTTTLHGLSEGICNVTAITDQFESSSEFSVAYDGEPTIKGDIPDIELEKDFGIYEINLTEHADDEYDDLSDLSWYLTGQDPDVIEVLGENNTGNHILTLLSEENAQGSMRVMYHLVNSADNEVSQKAWINLTADYQSPEFDTPPDLKVHYDKPYKFDYLPYITYDEERMDELELETDDPDHTEVQGLNVTYEYPEDMLGEEVLVVLTVSDGENSDHTAINVEVTSNDPPDEKEELPDLEIKQGELKENVFDLDDYFFDPEDEPLYMSYGYTYLSITLHANNTVDVEADVDWHGVETVTFRAEDSEGALIEQTIEVTVIPINYPPEIKELPEFVVHYEESYEFDLEYYISDRDNETHDLSISTDSEYVSVDGTELIMVFPEEMYNQTIPIEIFVSDGLETTSEITTVNVTDVYPPELVIPLHDVAFKEDDQLTNAFHLDNHFIDRQNDTIYYSSGNEYIDVEIHENSSVDFSAPDNWYGQELITLRANNSAGALMEDSLNVTVTPVNDPPVVSDIPKQEGEVGENWILDMGDYISDVDNNKNELEIIVQSPNVEVYGQKLFFGYDESGDYNVTVEVSDGLDTTTDSIEVIVEQPKTGPWYSNNIVLLFGLTSLGLIGVAFYVKRGEYTIEDIFLIHDSGGLIKHIARTVNEERDEDILAGMFTAVQNFVDDAFAEEDDEVLKRMEYGDKKVLVHKGDSVILAVFISGDEPKWALEGMKNLVSDIEERYGEDIKDWPGGLKDVSDITEMLEALHESRGKYRSGDWEKYSKD
ncbi:MAG: hypothetical protein ACOCSJ_00175 [Candidatus Natronoplasma sp.]